MRVLEVVLKIELGKLFFCFVFGVVQLLHAAEGVEDYPRKHDSMILFPLNICFEKTKVKYY